MVSSRTLLRDFGGICPQTIWGPKTIYYRQLGNSMATLRANISREEHDIDNWETTLEKMKGEKGTSLCDIRK